MPNLLRHLLPLICCLALAACSLGYDELSTGRIGADGDTSTQDVDGKWGHDADDFDAGEVLHEDSGQPDDTGTPGPDVGGDGGPVDVREDLQDAPDPPDTPAPADTPQDEPPPADPCARVVVPEVGSWSGRWSGNGSVNIPNIASVNLYIDGSSTFTISCVNGTYPAQGTLSDDARIVSGTMTGSFDPTTGQLTGTLTLTASLSAYGYNEAVPLSGSMAGSARGNAASGSWSASGQSYVTISAAGTWTANH